ncbi:MAG: ABC-F family ATP-binding cassette domain-containing protein [Paludibacteraceae bacterium]|nr:ABC-F family ATP-binding cassette domain-containing protein [Paludibacteraceae bacterium]
MPVSYLQVENLTKSFGDKLLFERISFGISEGQRVALVARNGSGKTTLLNIITGEQDYDEGQISTKRDLRIGYLSQQPSFPEHMTVLQACMLHAPAETELQKEWDYETKYKQILGKLSISHLEQKIGTLSGGQLKRVALASVLISEPELLILDEPTNHLDLSMVEWLEDFLRRSSMALLMVTHDRYFLDRVCSDILEIDQQTLFTYHGNYSYYLEKRAERIDVFNAETEKYKNLYRTELDWMRRMPQARGHKSVARKDAFYQIEDRAKQQIIDQNIHLENRGVYIGSKIFEAQYINKSYVRETGECALAHSDGNQPERLVILKDFYYNFARFEKMGIIGNNGTGKSTFLKMLLGIEKPDSGRFDIGETVQFGYFSQSGLPFSQGMKVLDVIREEAEEIDMGGGRRLTASQFLQHFQFSPSQQYDYVDKLSGGEKQRLNLCRVLMRNPNFLILDEPTNDLDIQTLNILEDYLQHFRGCLIVVSHDRYFMDKVVDHLLVFKGQGVVKDFPGNYTQYRYDEEQKSKDETRASDNATPQKADVKGSPISVESAKPRLNEKPRKLSFKEQQELKALEAELPQLEDEKAGLEAALSGGLTDMNEIAKASARYEEVQRLLDEKEMRWLELSEI